MLATPGPGSYLAGKTAVKCVRLETLALDTVVEYMLHTDPRLAG